jgi:hypothetical protein
LPWQARQLCCSTWQEQHPTPAPYQVGISAGWKVLSAIKLWRPAVRFTTVGRHSIPGFQAWAWKGRLGLPSRLSASFPIMVRRQLPNPSFQRLPGLREHHDPPGIILEFGIQLLRPRLWTQPARLLVVVCIRIRVASTFFDVPRLPPHPSSMRQGACFSRSRGRASNIGYATTAELRRRLGAPCLLPGSSNGT